MWGKRMADNIIIYKKKVYYNSIFLNIIKPFFPLIIRLYGFRMGKVNGSIPSEIPCLIACHHEEKIDQFAVKLAIQRRLFWVADTSKNKALADTIVRKFFMRQFGVVPIDKRNPKRNANLFDYLLFLLNEGEAVVFFPEAATKNHRNNEKFGEFKSGVVRLALEYEKKFGSNLPIYPIGLRYDSSNQININIGDEIYATKIEDMLCLEEEIKRLSLNTF